MARNLQWVDARFGHGIASLLEDYASDLFTLFGDDDEAIELALARLDSAARLRTPDAEVRLLRARMLASLGRTRQARRLLEELVEEGPRKTSVLAELASIAEDEGEGANAERLYKEAIKALREHNPEAEYTVLGYASLLTDAGRAVDARPIVKRWIAKLEKAGKPHRALDDWLARHPA